MKEKIRKAFNEAISHYPELKNEHIKIKEKNMNCTMQAWPVTTVSFFIRRKYVIYINKGNNVNIKDLSYKGLVGKIGHELAHIIDYKDMSIMSIIFFAFLYRTYPKFRRMVERSTDITTIEHGLGEELLEAVKIITQSDIPKAYRKRIRKYYLSLQEIEDHIEEQHPKYL